MAKAATKTADKPKDGEIIPPASAPATETVNQETGEISNVPAVPEVKRSLSEIAQSIGGKNFKVKQQVTFPQLKIEDGKEYAIKFLSNIYDGKEIPKNASNPITQIARLARVTNLFDNVNYEMILNSVLEGALKEAFPKDPKEKDPAKQVALVEGKMIAFRRSDIKGKRYKAFEIVEIELE